MNFLVVGAGAVGGYFGGRLVQKGEDVTFLVRPHRQKQLQEHGLVIKSVHGDFSSPVQTITADDPARAYDVILLSVKAYSCKATLDQIRPFVGEHTVILPLLNGIAHYLDLQASFGVNNVYGGLCSLETTLDADGVIHMTSPLHDLVFGEWNGGVTDRAQAIFDRLSGANFTARLSDNIQQPVWHKYILISVMAGITTLMNAPIGPILENEHSRATCFRLLSEIVSIAKLAGAPAAEDVEAVTLKSLQNFKPGMKSSMQRDVEKGNPVEADHLHGTLLDLAASHGKPASDFPVLQAAYGNLKVYESKRDPA